MTETELTLGTAQLGMAYGLANRSGGRPRPALGEKILATALELGVRSLDTAPQYGESEALIGRFLQRVGRSDDVSICTKLPRLGPGLDAGELNRGVTAALEASRKRLASDTIDYYLVHEAQDLQHHGASLVDALQRCQQAGWVKHIGVSVYSPQQARDVLDDTRLDAIQFPFNLFDQRMRASGCAPRLAQTGRATFARSALLQGLLVQSADSTPAHLPGARPWLENLEALCRRHEIDAAALAIAYAAQRSSAGHLVLGVDSCEQLVAATQAMRQPLSQPLVAEIESRYAAVPLAIIDPRRWPTAQP